MASQSWIWVLLWSKDEPIGIMGISSRETREYTSNDENLLVAIGRQLATTIEKVRLYEETCRAYEDLRHTQEQLLQSEKMSAVGQLIAGVAHELNNPLTAILGYAQLLESEGLQRTRRGFRRQIIQAGATHASRGAKPAFVCPPAQAAESSKWISARCSMKRWPCAITT